MKYSISDGVISYSIGADEFVVYNSNDEVLVVLNGEGQLIWESIEDEEQLEKLIGECGYANKCIDVIKALEEKNFIRYIE